ncbi:MAG: FHA domain-containing protein [Terriglobia bacterium]
MPASLEFLSGSRKGERLVLREEPMTVGRSPESSIVFRPEEELVSAEHATFLYGEGKYRLRDTGSPSGTFVNHRRITEQVLRHGDVIEFGLAGPAARFRIEEAAQVPPARRPSTASEIVRDVRARGGGTTEALKAMYQHSKRRTRRAVALVAVVGVVAVLGLYFKGEYDKAHLKDELGQYAAALFAERGKRADLETLIARLSEVERQDESQAYGNEQLQELRGDIQALERLFQLEQTLIQEYGDSVCLIVGRYGFVHRASTQWLRFEVNEDGSPKVENDVPVVRLGGKGPPLTFAYTGTGFLVGEGDWVLTNRHITNPWEEDSREMELIQEGLQPQFLVLLAYFPNLRTPYSLEQSSASKSADVGLLRIKDGAPVPRPSLPLAAGNSLPQAGGPAVLMGYPTGPESLLIRGTDLQERRKIVERARRAGAEYFEDYDYVTLVDELGRRDLIRPLTTRGIINEATEKNIVYDAQTTHGGSGGPLFDQNEVVVAINYGGHPEFSGSNLGVPIRYAWALLPASVRQPAPRGEPARGGGAPEGDRAPAGARPLPAARPGEEVQPPEGARPAEEAQPPEGGQPAKEGQPPGEEEAPEKDKPPEEGEPPGEEPSPEEPPAESPALVSPGTAASSP